MDNSMQNMLEMYLYETNTMVEQLDEILLEAENVGTFSVENINEIFRIMHTIKGSSAMMQFNPLSTLAHQVENLFFFMRENGGHNEIGHDLFNALFRASDFIKAQISNIENNEPLSDDIGGLTKEIQAMLASLQNAQAGEDVKSEAQEATASEAEQPNGSRFCIKVFFDEGVGMENLRSFMLVNTIKESCPIDAYEPAEIETDQSTAAQIIEQGFIMYFNAKDDLDMAIGIVESSLNIRTYESMELSQAEAGAPEQAAPPEPTSEKTEDKAAAGDTALVHAEPPKPGQAPAQAPAAQSQAHPGKQNLISVNLTKLDKLMDIVGEIVITESMVTSSPDIQGFKLDSFTKSARQLRKLTDDLQDTVMSIRMVPVSGVFQKMNRIVRDMSQALDRPAKLVVVGAETEVDKTIVDSIGDPIMHMVRNAMDHGIEESADDRVAVGKDPTGTVTLSAQHTGGEVIISIEDDGRGINTQKVLDKARDQGLLIKPESEYSQKEILQLLLLPGFSTNENVTEFSGRGVGMDVVKKNIEKVGGVVSMTSEIGRGTVTTLNIPLTLAIVDGMEIVVGDSIFTIPLHNIRSSFKVASQDIIYDSAGGEMICRMESFYPIVRLHEFYGLETEVTGVEEGIVIWIEAGDKSYCLFVDRLLGEQQVVVKPLPNYLYAFNIKKLGIAGCTILGDGNISIILDIPSLYEAAVSRI
ncbi:MAG: chemotaxis protein CheA [Clostridiales bacterium]|nr:chemotaxis protein CheA [Clostridiales bacterium]